MCTELKTFTNTGLISTLVNEASIFRLSEAVLCFCCQIELVRKAATVCLVARRLFLALISKPNNNIIVFVLNYTTLTLQAGRTDVWCLVPTLMLFFYY